MERYDLLSASETIMLSLHLLSQRSHKVFFVYRRDHQLIAQPIMDAQAIERERRTGGGITRWLDAGNFAQRNCPTKRTRSHQEHLRCDCVPCGCVKAADAPHDNNDD